jgi:hypothetical protein
VLVAKLPAGLGLCLIALQLCLLVARSPARTVTRRGSLSAALIGQAAVSVHHRHDHRRAGSTGRARWGGWWRRR